MNKNKLFRFKNFTSGKFLKDRKGYTLIEMVVVIAIIAIFSGLVGVSLDDLNSNTRLSNASSRAMADIRYASELAMAHRREVDIIVSVQSNKYEIKWHDTGAYVPSPIDQEDLIVYFNTGEYQNVSLTSSGLEGPLSFIAFGAPLINGSSFSNQTSIMLINNNMHVVVHPSGYVSLQETINENGGCIG